MKIVSMPVVIILNSTVDVSVRNCLEEKRYYVLKFKWFLKAYIARWISNWPKTISFVYVQFLLKILKIIDIVLF